MQNSLDPNRKYGDENLNHKKEGEKVSPATAKIRNAIKVLCAVLLIAGVAFAIKRSNEQTSEDVPAEVDPRILVGTWSGRPESGQPQCIAEKEMTQRR